MQLCDRLPFFPEEVFECPLKYRERKRKDIQKWNGTWTSQD